jgi:hypothetical protein
MYITGIKAEKKHHIDPTDLPGYKTALTSARSTPEVPI